MGTMNLFAAKLMESLWDFGDLQSEGGFAGSGRG